jgi:hypothetical protein
MGSRLLAKVVKSSLKDIKGIINGLEKWGGKVSGKK